MGPLIPLEIISPSWNNVFAMIIGILFGFILESSGFSSSRKLVGVFYGYDFTVLKVFMTAAVTAAIGIYYFHFMGWLDLSMIYVNPAYITPAIVGGAIMGLGFILGGYCPGTSYCGAAIGKIDAIVYSVSMALGIFLFSELYPLFENFYNSGYLGNVTVYETLGLPVSVFMLILIVVALVAFVIADAIKKRIKKVEY